jgi:hypothetical protein
MRARPRNAADVAFEDPTHGRSPLSLGAGLWVRRALMTVFLAVVVAALLNAFGQKSSQFAANGPVASLTLAAPDRVRGGLFWEARANIVASRAVERPRLVLEDGWLEGMQVNTIEPAPSSESSRNGRLVLTWNTLEGGDRLQIWFQFQVNPTNVGRRDASLEFDDGDTPLARIDRTITVLP